MADGKIIQSLSGYYDVDSNGEIHRCRGRGNFRKKKVTPLVGDFVEFQDGYILDVKPRRNEMLRPPLANLDQGILVFSAVEPDFQPLLLDRFLVRLEMDDIPPIICFSKMDLADEDKRSEIGKYADDYQKVGYDVLFTSTAGGENYDTVRSLLEGKTSVFAGQSGVGKSSLLNALDPQLALKTGVISEALGRGKHTTRRIKLLPIGSGFVADTPGFSSLDFRGIEADELSACFPEMRERAADCKFRGCSHLTEPKCAVKDALSAGEIADYRYEHYKQFYTEIQAQKRRY
ncbi:MAG TPA: ribosome small subunit-dependent GTPase A [Bacillales bacterium]|jgi:ribosome biogenesis GTPase|nr:ribosome small subunit-dependent GTPase A [Bacillales bacterium]